MKRIMAMVLIGAACGLGAMVLGPEAVKAVVAWTLGRIIELACGAGWGN